jgi:hypothetical protein
MTEITFMGQSGIKWTYHTDQVLGTGGFGSVYAAEAADGTLMALKVVSKHGAAGTLDNRLLRREIEIGRRVRDSGGDMLLPVIDVSETSDALLLVMSRAGAPLSAVLPVSEAEAIAAMTDIATGLQQLHLAGIIHRDLKPLNVLQHDRHWKLADFGIARDEEIGTQDPTFIGAGSLPYMAPELWQLKSPTVKTDLYALGCLGFELLTGVRPFTGDLAALRAAHLTKPLPEAPYSNPTVKNLVSRLAAKDPGDRPQDARAVLERLQRAALPHTPTQLAIASGLGAHYAEKSRTAARVAEAEAAVAVNLEQITQGAADLIEILNDALEELQAVEPDATLWTQKPERSRGTSLPVRLISPRISLSAIGTNLGVHIWDNVTIDKPIAGDSMIIAGHVDISNPRHSQPFNCANIVYELVEGRYAWQEYRFHAVTPIKSETYRYGPHDRSHGLDWSRFLVTEERYRMLKPGKGLWRVTVELLTADSTLKLFQEAVDLEPADSRPSPY